MINSMEIKIDARLENVSTIRLAITTFASNLNITFDDIVDIKTAVSEAMTNAIEHGYENKEGNIIIINCNLDLEEEKIEIIIKDFGVGIEDIGLAMTPEYTSKPEEEHAGMGFTIMENFMDEIVVNSTKDEGTEVILYKKIKRKSSN